MMSKPAPKAPAASVALYDALLATIPAVERKGATMPYTSVHGNMFSLLTPDGTLALRLPAAEREAFLKRYETGLCEQYGVVMKEYVRVPPRPVAEHGGTREIPRRELPPCLFAQAEADDKKDNREEGQRGPPEARSQVIHVRVRH